MIYLSLFILAGFVLIIFITETVKYTRFKKNIKVGAVLYNVVKDMFDDQDKGELFILTIDEVHKNYVVGHFTDYSKYKITIQELYNEHWKFNK